MSGRARWRWTLPAAAVALVVVVAAIVAASGFFARPQSHDVVRETSATIGPDGGTLVLGDLRLTVPPGALAADAEVAARQFNAPAAGVEDVPAGDVLAIFDVAVDGELIAPLRMEFGLEREGEPVEVFHRTAGGAWEPRPSNVDRDVAVTWTLEFSEFAWTLADPNEATRAERLDREISRLLKVIAEQGVWKYQYDWDPSITGAIAAEWSSLLEFLRITDLRGPYDNLWWAGYGYQESALEALHRARQALDQGDIQVAEQQYGHARRYWQFSWEAWSAAADVFIGNMEAAYQAAEAVKEGAERALQVGGLLSGVAVAYGATAATPAALQLFDRSLILVRWAEDAALEGVGKATRDALAAVIVKEMLDGVKFSWDGGIPMTIAERAGFGFGSGASNWLQYEVRWIGPETARHVFIALSETAEWELVEGGEELLRLIFGEAADGLVAPTPTPTPTPGHVSWLSPGPGYLYIPWEYDYDPSCTETSPCSGEGSTEGPPQEFPAGLPFYALVGVAVIVDKDGNDNFGCPVDAWRGRLFVSGVEWPTELVNRQQSSDLHDPSGVQQVVDLEWRAVFAEGMSGSQVFREVLEAPCSGDHFVDHPVQFVEGLEWCIFTAKPEPC